MSDKDRDKSMDSIDIIDSLKKIETHIKTIRRNMRLKWAEKYRTESISTVSTVSTVSTTSTEIESWEPPDINQNLSSLKTTDAPPVTSRMYTLAGTSGRILIVNLNFLSQTPIRSR